jgi:hypothetical protein
VQLGNPPQSGDVVEQGFTPLHNELVRDATRADGKQVCCRLSTGKGLPRALDATSAVRMLTAWLFCVFRMCC